MCLQFHGFLTSVKMIQSIVAFIGLVVSLGFSQSQDAVKNIDFSRLRPDYINVNSIVVIQIKAEPF